MTKQDEEESSEVSTDSDGWCSFCGKSRHEVERMIHGGPRHNRVAICNECVELFAGIMAEECAR